MNQTNVAANLIMYGVNPLAGTNKITISGSASLIGVLNAPAYDLTISGSGMFIGAAITNTANISGSGGLHYDQALTSLGGNGASTYTVASWVEDLRPLGQ